MTRLFALACCVALVLSVPAVAGDMTRGLEINGGPNAFAQLTVERADRGEVDGVLKLHVTLAETKDLKGYGFVIEFDPAKYEFLEAKEIQGHLLETGSGQQTLFLSSNRTPGQLSLGAMKVDGQSASGEGKLVEITLRTTGDPLPTDFQIADGLLVDLDGNIDPLTQIEIGNLKPTPDRFALAQNAPNPFNPSTTISYELPEATNVRIAIYNLLGQEIRMLVKGAVEAGYYTATWDGRDRSGRQVASGIYLYRMQAGKYSQARRMMLLK